MCLQSKHHSTISLDLYVVALQEPAGTFSFSPISLFFVSSRFISICPHFALSDGYRVEAETEKGRK